MLRSRFARIVKHYVDILQEIPSFEKKLSNACEVISHVVSATRIEGYG
jgi:hypothetical protein